MPKDRYGVWRVAGGISVHLGKVDANSPEQAIRRASKLWPHLKNTKLPQNGFTVQREKTQ